MHTFLNRSLLVGAITLAFAGGAIASQASKPASPAQAKAAAPSTTKVHASSSHASTAAHSAMGTIEKYDANMLTLKTASGEEQFTLASSAHLRNGSKTIKADDLSGLVGKRAKVRFTENNGTRTAESVMVSSGRSRSKTSKS